MHDFGGEGFFVKDQATPIAGLVVEDKLSPFQIFGPIAGASIRNSTAWAAGDGVLPDSGWADAVFADDVFDKLGRDATVSVTGANNTCYRLALSPMPGTSSPYAPPFLDAALGDPAHPRGARRDLVADPGWLRTLTASGGRDR